MSEVKREVSDRLLIIGDQMANACFNLAQNGRKDAILSPRIVEMLREMRVAWDAERRKCKTEQSARESAQGEGVTLRASVRWFAEQMELALRDNDHKGGWHESSPHSLLARVLEESSELIDTIMPEPVDQADFHCASRNARFAANLIAAPGYFAKMTSVGNTIREAADVANMAHMVADHYREGGPSLDQGHTLPPPPKAEGEP